jgi:asparagine synthetase B (glutamine-hydrolysing)
MFSLPAVYKIHDGWTKYLVRKALEGIVPEKVLWRREKVGFATPQQQWMRSPAIQALAHDAHSYLVAEGIVNKGWMNKGEHDWEMIQAWFLLTGAGRAAAADTSTPKSVSAGEIQSPPERAFLT